MQVEQSERSIPVVVQRMERVVSRITRMMAVAAGCVFLPLAFYMTMDATSRKLGGPFTAVSDDIAGQCLAFGATCSLAYALARGAHVRIDVLMPLYPAKLREFLFLVTVASAATLGAVLAWYAWQLSYDSYLIDARAYSMLGQPLAYGQALTVIGYTMFTVQGIVILVASGFRFVAGVGVAPATEAEFAGDI